MSRLRELKQAKKYLEEQIAKEDEDTLGYVILRLRLEGVEKRIEELENE